MKCLILLLLFPIVSQANDITISGFVAGELRWFTSDAQFEDQFNGMQSSLIIQPEFRSKSADRFDQYTFIPYARLDNRDNSRSHFDIREAHWQHIDDEWSLLFGVNRVFWGVTESNHLIDIINQTDLVDNINGEEKLGQPMLNLSLQNNWGDLNLFVMPLFRERIYSSEAGRLRSKIVVSKDVQYESTAEQHHMDLALRYSHYIDEWDFGLYYFKGTGREPRFLLNSNGKQLVALYDQIDQFGVDIQLTDEAWLWKFEAIARSQNNEHFGAFVGGFEYTFYQIGRSSTDLGLLLEYMYDGRNDSFDKQPPTLFDDDLFLATRIAMNDNQDSEILVGVIIDQNNHSSLLSIEAKRRLNNNWSIELESKFFINANENTSLSVFKNDNYLTLRLARYI